MAPSLLLGTMLLAPAAPVPADAVVNPAGSAPHVAYLHGDANGNVKIHGYTIKPTKQFRSRITVVNGQRIVKREEVEMQQRVHFELPLTEASMKLSTADGKALMPADAIARVKGGAVVLISADGKPVENAWLRAFGSDTIVLTSDSLVGAQITMQGSGNPSTPAPRLVLLTTNADGKVTIAYNPNSNQPSGNPVQVQAIAGRANLLVVNGRAQQGGIRISTNAPAASATFPSKPLEDVKFDAYDLKGTIVPHSAAMKRLRAGGLVLIAGDGRLPDQRFLNVFRGELLVLVSNELALPAGAKTTPPAGIIRRAPLVPAVPLPVAVPARPLKVVPLPAVRPAVVPGPVPAPVKKS